jgi:hypothetical protein
MSDRGSSRSTSAIPYILAGEVLPLKATPAQECVCLSVVPGGNFG